MEIFEIKSCFTLILVEEINGRRKFPLFSFAVRQRFYECNQDLHPFIPGCIILNSVVSVDWKPRYSFYEGIPFQNIPNLTFVIF